MIKKMGVRKSRRKFLKRLSALAGAAIVPGLAVEDALAIPITTAGATAKKKKAVAKKKAAPKKKKAVAKKKAAPKRKKATVKRKAAPKRKKAVAKKKAAPKRKVVAKRSILPYEYQYEYPLDTDQPPRGVPEPSTVGLVSIGVAAIALAKRLKKKGQKT
jgi:hypothetical protein